MNQTQLLDKLATLDPDNKDHWNQDDQPRLGAIGEGVKREDVLAVAPLFSRKNPVLNSAPEVEELTEEEIKDALQEKAEELQLKREEAQAALAKAHALSQEAERIKKEASAAMEAIRDELKELDPRTDAEINRDLLKASFAERLNRAGAQAQARELLEKAGLGHHARALTSSPVDRAIAERVVAERRKKLAGK